MDWIRRATETLTLESDAIRDLIPKVGIEFKAVGQLLLEMKGRVVITGIGKSAIIAQKLAATFNSTGTPAIFMHAADAIHGDLGLVQRDDLVRVTGPDRRSRRAAGGVAEVAEVGVGAPTIGR